jgi:hypothetical protein
MDYSKFLDYGLPGILVIVLIGAGYGVNILLKFVQKQAEFVQKIAEDSIKSQEEHTRSWREMTTEVLKTINGFTVALGEVKELITLEARSRREEHRKMEEGLRKESL